MNVTYYSDYLRERTNDEVVETDYGFATYRYVEEGKSVYIVDIYVTPEARKEGHAAEMADQIAKIAKEKGCTSMIGTVQPSTKGSTTSLQVLLGYGMRLQSASQDAIIMRKDL